MAGLVAIDEICVLLDVTDGAMSSMNKEKKENQ